MLRVKHGDGQRREGAQDLQVDELGQAARFAEGRRLLAERRHSRHLGGSRGIEWPASAVRSSTEVRMHIVLLGDSIFDNGAYVRAGDPDVVRQLQARLPARAKATLAAVDGATTAGVARQLERLPAGATHLIVSAGGNDALGNIGVLEESSHSIADALTRLAEIGDGFARDYRAMLRAVLDRGKPTALCTIYEPRYPEPGLQRLAVTGLTLFNDAIVRAAFANGLPLLDLRLIFDEDGDYANPIEPSAQGGDKIAAAIGRLVAEHDFGRRRTEVFVH
jgi:lysophospholipase L1-like esterase